MPEKNINERKILNPLECLIIGGLAGGVEVSANLPLWTIKMRSQCNLPFTLDPRVLYKGYFISITTMAAITSMQLFNSSMVERSTIHEKTISQEQRIFTAFVGGAVSSIILNPINLIGTQQHKHNWHAFSYAALKTINKIGFKGLFVGISATAVTDGIYTCAFYGAYPYLKKTIDHAVPSSSLTSLGAGCLSGVLAAVTSHAFDMIKTRQHNDVDEIKKTATFVFRELYQKKNGIGFFNKGLAPRIFLSTSSVAIAGIVADKVEAYIAEKPAFKK